MFGAERRGRKRKGAGKKVPRRQSGTRPEPRKQPPERTKATVIERTIEQHVERIRALDADRNKGDVARRYEIAVEVKAIHAADKEKGIKKAAKLLKNWSAKTLYEYEAVAETWDTVTFKHISKEVGPSGNSLYWSDYVGLTYIDKPDDREGARKQALAENTSIKTMKNAKAREKGRENSEETDVAAEAPLASALCEVRNKASALGRSLSAVTTLLERPAQEVTPQRQKLFRETADHLDALADPLCDVVSMLRELAAIDAAEPMPPTAGFPASRNDNGATAGESDDDTGEQTDEDEG